MSCPAGKQAAGRMSEPDISVCLPAHNEQETLREVALRSLDALREATSGRKEFLIVNDGSTDATGCICRELALRHQEVRLYEHPSNLGYAAAQQSCYRNAGCEWIFLLPADGQIDPRVLLDFIPRCADNDLILGVERKPSERTLRRFFSAAYHAFVRRLFGLRIGRFGACLMVRRSVANSVRIRAKTPVAMTELVVRSILAGARVAEVDVARTPRGRDPAHGMRVLLQAPRIALELTVLFCGCFFLKIGRR